MALSYNGHAGLDLHIYISKISSPQRDDRANQVARPRTRYVTLLAGHLPYPTQKWSMYLCGTCRSRACTKVTAFIGGLEMGQLN